jgi:NAD(P)H-nitrite reductase large subunit
MDSCCTPESCLNCPGRIVCRCLQVTESVLVEALTTLNLRTVRDVRRHTGAGDGCTACHRRLKQYLEQYAYSSASPICSVK